MCGIIGVAGNIPEKKIIEEARDSIRHRGPDDAGIYYAPEEGVSFGHRRLSIIDLTSAGHQPFHSNNDQYIVTFNGEIYNYLELKQELKDVYEFKTNTDTEVLLAAYQHWGEACLNKFNGMFSFAIWDREKKKLFCARDRVGIKPFYYTYNNDTIAFASEIKALIAMGVEKKINEGILFDYLRYGLYDHTDETFFEGVRVLPPGHYLIFSGGKLEIKKYWDLADVKIQKDISEEEVEKTFRELLQNAIELRFRSDVKVGLNLSSGLDSNSLYHYALAVTNEDLHTFSMCLQSEEYNECSLIDETLSEDKKKFWHTCFLSRDSVLAGAEDMNEIQDQPFGGIPTISYKFLIELARDNGVTVLLEGQGVDEILAGYPYYAMEHKKDLLNDTKSGGSVGLGQDGTRLINEEILSEDFVNRNAGRTLSFFKPFTSHLLNAQYRDIRYTKLPRVLRFNDHVTMHLGRELRVPFLDHRLIEFCFSLSEKYKIHNGTHKVLLRNIMDSVIPKKIQKKKKKVFGAIQTEWFKGSMKEKIYALLDSSSFKRRDYWNHDQLKKEVDKFFAGERNNSFFIWQCLNLEMWLQKYIDKAEI